MANKVKKQKTFPLQLTKFELVHLRDLFGVVLPLELKQTVSQALATVEDRVMVEAKLWQKITAACSSASIPMDDDAPDFICAASAAPPVGVFKLAQEPNEGQTEATADEGSVFGGAQGVDEEDEAPVPTSTTQKACPRCGNSPRTQKCPFRCEKK